MWDSSTTTPDEFVHFIEQLNSKQFADVQKFFDTMPALRHKVVAKNPKTEVEFDYVIEGLSNFFAWPLFHNSLENYYRSNFALMQHHNYSLTELDSLIPWEYDIYTTLLRQYLEEEKKRIEQQRRS